MGLMLLGYPLPPPQKYQGSCQGSSLALLHLLAKLLLLNTLCRSSVWVLCLLNSVVEGAAHCRMIVFRPAHKLCVCLFLDVQGGKALPAGCSVATSLQPFETLFAVNVLSSLHIAHALHGKEPLPWLYRLLPSLRIYCCACTLYRPALLSAHSSDKDSAISSPVEIIQCVPVPWQGAWGHIVRLTCTVCLVCFSRIFCFEWYGANRQNEKCKRCEYCEFCILQNVSNGN